MKKYDESWWMHFVPECYFDTVLLKRLLGTNKRVLHVHGCNNVINKLKGKFLNDDFGVGLIDKDKIEIDYLKESEVVREVDGLIIWKNKIKMHFVFQLNPPIEKWLIKILNDEGLKIENFGYPSEFKKLKKGIKDDIDDENDIKLNKLVDAIIATNCETIRVFKASLMYLKEKNYAADINELKNV